MPTQFPTQAPTTARVPTLQPTPNPTPVVEGPVGLNEYSQFYRGRLQLYLDSSCTRLSPFSALLTPNCIRVSGMFTASIACSDDGQFAYIAAANIANCGDSCINDCNQFVDRGPQGLGPVDASVLGECMPSPFSPDVWIRYQCVQV